MGATSASSCGSLNQPNSLQNTIVANDHTHYQQLLEQFPSLEGSSPRTRGVNRHKRTRIVLCPTFQRGKKPCECKVAELRWCAKLSLEGRIKLPVRFCKHTSFNKNSTGLVSVSIPNLETALFNRWQNATGNILLLDAPSRNSAVVVLGDRPRGETDLRA